MCARSLMEQRLSLLVVAYSATPRKGSEAGIGWNLAAELAARHHVTLVTEASNQRPIEATVSRTPGLSLEVLPVKSVVSGGRWRGLAASNTRYFTWHHRAAETVSQLTKGGAYHLSQHLTWGRYWMPTAAAASHVPFVVGPVGGAETTPKAFRQEFDNRSRRADRIRGVVRCASSIDPLTRKSLSDAAWFIASSKETYQALVSRSPDRVSIMPSVGLNPEEVPEATEPLQAGDFICVGRLLSWKGFDLALRAMATDPLSDATLAIVGDGPQRQRLEALAASLGLRGRVRFLGRVKREAVFSMMASARALVHPSLHDSGGVVLAEAMHVGTPVIALDIGGPGVIVSRQAGLLVAPVEPGQTVKDLGAAMVSMLDDEKRESYSEGAKRRSAELTWSATVDQFEEIYSRILARSRPSDI